MTYSEETPLPSLPSVASLLSATHGKWRDALIDGGIPAPKLDGERHSCPRCGGWNRFYALPDVDQHGRVHCDRCFNAATVVGVDGITSLQWVMGADFGSACISLSNRYDLPGFPANLRVPIAITKTLQEYAAALRAEDPPSTDIAQISLDFQAAATEEKLRECSRCLNLQEPSLQRLEVGWSQSHEAFTFPMEDGWGRVSGLRLLSLKRGETWSLGGAATEGLFVPIGLVAPTSRLYIAEGPVAAAACLSLGLPCIGSSGRLQCETLLQYKLMTLCPMECVFMTDQTGMGIGGGRELADSIANCSRSIRLVVPPKPYSTISEWLTSSSTRADVEEQVEACTVYSRRESGSSAS
ncbi:hypothetical protein [Aporhodopirellula aestuarii]|uniref:DNA primase n=1 Tax=Aporhodopirellula aestuarii TaxID=2950107 RepID=A0ABT0U0I1_9BACT|nr:hypothetical protein [Aporhodopirellula aestuarii]MCM2370379.1 hypothetical protein [Aporhodopirellula aestuarii]